ncbi:MAG: hypothetical protein QNJ73_11780 [Gammaproteobacteria bacterium]|nr:hypothetical protein [Gammaproteobacteria bacterium]
MWSNGFLLTIELRPGPARRVSPGRVVIASGCVVLAVMPWPTGETRLGLLMVPLVLLMLFIERQLMRRRQILLATTLANGHWRLLTRDGHRVQAQLTRHWLTRTHAGLGWRDARRRHYHLILARADLPPQTWRRLAVRLRHPAAIA